MLKKILTFLCCAIFIIGCTVKPLHLQGDILLNINVTTEVSIGTYWNTSTNTNLVYDWDSTKYGPIGYTAPENVEVVIFDNGEIFKEQSIKTNRRQLIDVELDKTYDFLIYNKPSTIKSDYSGGRYYIYTPTKSTKSSILGQDYITVEQPGDIFSIYKTGVYLSSNLDQYDEIYENGKLWYVYNIDAVLHPVSYIYIIQLIVINDDNTTIEAKSINSLTISGICDNKDLFSETSKENGNKEIIVKDVHEGQYHNDSLVFAARFTILDLLPENNSSWVDTENYLYYSGINIETNSFGTVSGLVNITKEMKNNPKGGIITVIIKNSDLKKSGGNEGGGFNIDIEEWQNIYIDIAI